MSNFHLSRHQVKLSRTNQNDRCAAINGIDKSIVERSEEIILLSARGEDLVVACSIPSSEELADLVEAVSITCRGHNAL
jgi:hypothetical protein